MAYLEPALRILDTGARTINRAGNYYNAYKRLHNMWARGLYGGGAPASYTPANFTATPAMPIVPANSTAIGGALYGRRLPSHLRPYRLKSYRKAMTPQKRKNIVHKTAAGKKITRKDLRSLPANQLTVMPRYQEMQGLSAIMQKVKCAQKVVMRNTATTHGIQWQEIGAQPVQIGLNNYLDPFYFAGSTTFPNKTEMFARYKYATVISAKVKIMAVANGGHDLAVTYPFPVHSAESTVFTYAMPDNAARDQPISIEQALSQDRVKKWRISGVHQTTAGTFDSAGTVIRHSLVKTDTNFRKFFFKNYEILNQTREEYIDEVANATQVGTNPTNKALLNIGFAPDLQWQQTVQADRVQLDMFVTLTYYVYWWGGSGVY